MSWVWDHSQAGGTDRLVLLAIADSADHDGSNAWPSIATIARKCQISERTVQRSIRSLVDLGEIVVVPQGGGTPTMSPDRRPNLYRVTMRSGATDRHPEVDGVTDSAPRGDSVTPRGVTPVSPNPSDDPSETRTPPSTDVDRSAGFDVFWDLYPRRNGKRLGKAKALERWRKLSPASRTQALLGARAYAASVARGDTIARDPERFLANHYFEDWVPEATEEAPRTRDAVLDRNVARSRGEACPVCADSLFVENDRGEAVRCQRCAAA